MVDVSVRQKHKINLVGVDGELLILKDVFALFHAAVDETILAAALQKGATASHFVGCAQECHLHGVHHLLSLS